MICKTPPNSDATELFTDCVTEHKAWQISPSTLDNQLFQISTYNDARKGNPNKIPFSSAMIHLKY